MSKTILLADDSVTIQKVVDLAFREEEHQVVAVSNGDEALARMEALHPAIVITDVHMPGVSGYDVCRQAKRSRPATPVLLLVGTFEVFDEAECEACGADGHLRKPFDSKELVARVKELTATIGDAPAGAGMTLADSGPPDSGLADRRSAARGPSGFEPSDSGLAVPTGPTAVPPAVIAVPPGGMGSVPTPLPAPEPSPLAPTGPQAVVEPPPALAPVAEPPAAFEPKVAETEDSAPGLPEPEEGALESAPTEAEASEDSSSPEVATPASSSDSAHDAAAAEKIGALDDSALEQLARRVAELIGDQVVREVAWDVVPDMAEVVIKERLRELEQQVEDL